MHEDVLSGSSSSLPLADNLLFICHEANPAYHMLKMCFPILVSGASTSCLCHVLVEVGNTLRKCMCGQLLLIKMLTLSSKCWLG